MADFNIQPIGTQIKPVPGMSIADMINVARGAQAYQQAEQVNPLALQQQQQATRTGQIALGVEEQKDKERRNMQMFFSDPNNFQTDGRIDLDKINAAVPSIAPLTGAEYINKYTTLGQAQTQAISAKQNLTQDQRNMIASRFAILGRMGVQDKNAYIAEMDLLKKENPDNKDLARLIDAYKVTWNEIPSGPQLPGIAIAGAQTLLTPAQQQTLAPSISVTPAGQTVTTQPSVGGMEPKATVGIAGGMQAPAAPAPAAGVSAGTEIAPGMRLPYQVRRADQPYIPEPSEKIDFEAGSNYRNKLVSAQTGLAQNRRNTEEVISQANKIGSDLFFEKGGIPGQIEQKIRMAIGSEQYDMLAKDLANMALSNTQAMGGVGNTVAGLDMQQVANGTIKVPPDVLVKIARRVQADQTNLDMQANGAQLFSQRFGDNNMKAYQQAWNANADTKIFEAMNIIKDVSNPTQREKELNRLFPDEKKRSDFLTKYRNLKKLSETGSL